MLSLQPSPLPCVGVSCPREVSIIMSLLRSPLFLRRLFARVHAGRLHPSPSAGPQTQAGVAHLCLTWLPWACATAPPLTSPCPGRHLCFILMCFIEGHPSAPSREAWPPFSAFPSGSPLQQVPGACPGRLSPLCLCLFLLLWLSFPITSAEVPLHTPGQSLSYARSFTSSQPGFG